MKNYAFCNNCKEIVEASHVERDKKVYLHKECPKCGSNDYLISSDAARYRGKRAFMEDIKYLSCRFDCDSCGNHKEPDIIFIDTTNRCNMNCHICLNNVAAMGFKYEPRMEFFEKIFRHYSGHDPKPYIQLFGGEPTMREDLFEIIKLGKSYGFSMRVVTNGLKLADEKYCDELMRLGVMVLIAFDGTNRAMYDKLRGRADALDLKLKALENLSKRRRGKVILMAVVDKEQNKADMKEFFKFSFENLHVIRGIYFMPLIHTWDKKKLDYDPEKTTLEDVEHMVDAAIGGANTEFLPLGSLCLTSFYRMFNIKNMPFSGVHPNCESVTYLVSDGKEFVSASNFLKTSLYRLIGDLRSFEKYLAKKSAKRKINFLGRLDAYSRALSIAVKHVNFGAIVGAKGLPAFVRWVRIIGKISIGRKMKDVLRQDSAVRGVLQVLILPFEDLKTAEAERLSMCSSCFVFVDPETGEIMKYPLCTWERYKAPIMKKVSEKFNV